MAKNKTKNDLVMLTHYWRWQFLRLNKEYQKSYDRYFEFSKQRPDCRETIEEDIADLKKRYGINGAYDYRIQKPAADLKITDSEDCAVRAGSLKKLFGLHNPDIYGSYLVEETNGSIFPKYVEVVINLDAKKGEILKGISDIVNRYQKPKRRVLKLTRAKIRRCEVATLNLYLKVYSWSKDKGLSNIDIANKLQKMRVNIKVQLRQAAKMPLKEWDKMSDERKEEYRVKDILRSVENLINGGYRKINF